MSRFSSRGLSMLSVLACLFGAVPLPARAAEGDVVIYTSDVSTMQGNWTKVSSSSAAGGQRMTSADRGWSTADAPLANPADYFEATFSAPAYTSYRIWLRLRATADSKWNDSVWMQFSDAITSSGTAAYRIGSSSALLVNLERCKDCGVGGWGWQNTGYWLSQDTTVRFGAAGTHRLRVQTREDGVQIDQIVLSPSAYLSTAPGQATLDATIVPPSTPAPTSVSSTTTPYSGTPVAIPGTILMCDFDNGGEGVAYHDTTAGNTGAAYRQTGVDLQPSADGGNNVGWTAPGEWINYTVSVASSGTYNITFRVASAGQGGSFHVEMNGTDVTGPTTIPNTGGWQTWTSVTKSVTLAAGKQVARLVMDANGATGSVGNINSIKFAASSSSGGGGSSSTPYLGSAVAIPGTVQAENFDNGGEGISYHDTTTGNWGNAFRSTGVDLEGASSGGYNVGWVDAGEWLNYTVNVASAGTYTVSFRVASAGQGGTFHLEMNGSNVTGGLTVPNTGGWQAWQTITKTVSLSAGQQIARLRMNSVGATGAVGNFDSFQITSGAPPPAPTPSPTPSGTFRMMTWNIQHGRTKAGVYDPAAQARFIVSLNPDVVALQEVETWNEIQWQRYKSLLEQLTGQSWTVVWAPVTNAAGTEGNVLLTRLPVSSSTYFQMHATSDWLAMYSNRSIAQATVRVGSVYLNVYSTHLDAYNTTHRTIQEQQMMAWLTNFGGPRLVSGDFNAWWGESWITTMQTQYSDTWVDITGSKENGYTIGNVRFDYIFRSFSGGSRATPTNCFVAGTSLSDHSPLVADFSVQ